MPETKTMKTGTLHRSFALDRAAIDSDARTVPLSFSSEEPYPRWFGEEILDHSKGAVRLGRLKQSGPLLMDHNTRDQIGVVESVEIGSDRKGRAVVRFGKGDRAEEIFQDVVDGVRANVSVGYIVHKFLVDEEKDTYTAKDWEPLEISIVSVPADISVGVGRGHDDGDHEAQIELLTREAAPEDPVAPPQQPILEENNAMPETQQKTVDEIRAEERSAELSRIREIRALGQQHKMPELADQFVDNGKTVEECRQAILEKYGAKPVDVQPEIGLSPKETREFSFVRAINALANPSDRKLVEAAGFEFECSEAVQKRTGKRAQGIMIPMDVLKRDLTVGTAADGGNLVATDMLAGSFIEMLRNMLVVNNMGARVLTGLVGDVAIPSQTGGATAYWVAESGSPTESKQAFGQVTLSPNTVGAYTDISRKLLKQSSVDVEMLVMEDIAKQLAIAIDSKALYGDGLSNTPTGVAETSGINAPASFAAATPTYLELLAMLGAVAVDNALLGSLGFVTDPALMATLMGTARFSSTSLPIWADNGTIAGYKAMASSQVTAGDVFFGNWNDLILGQWGTLDLTVDPYTGSTAGTVRVVGLQDVDVAVRHAVSFAYNNDGA